MIEVAFANDCDRLTWETYQYIHGAFERLSLSVGDSFWLFSPENEDMALFRDGSLAKTTNHDNLLGQIKEGRIDVLHGVGSFGRRPDYPDRDAIRRAFDYLDKQGGGIRIWSNHGNSNHVHNIAAQGSRSYQQGDLPYSQHYVHDITRDFGIEYYWLSHNLRHSLDTPFRVLRDEGLPSGETIRTFTRFAPSWQTNAWTFAQMITRESLEQALAAGQNVIYFTHWGFRGKDADETKPLLSRESMMALAALAEMQAEGMVRVVRLHELLQRESQRTLDQEVGRVGRAIVDTHHADLDVYYKKQFEPDSIAYYADLVDSIGMAGKALLDAGGGTGNLCFSATRKFESVVCQDMNTKALAAGREVADALQLQDVHFLDGNLEEFHVGQNVFDLIFSRSVIYMVDVTVVLKNFYEMIRPGGTVLVTVNGDGFYLRAIEQKKKAERYGHLLWNTMHHRFGGDRGLLARLRGRAITQAVAENDDAGLFDLLLQDDSVPSVDAMRKYPREIRSIVGGHAASYLLRLAAARGELLDPSLAGRAEAAVMPERNKWRCYYPDEFERLARQAGFKMFMWRDQEAMLPADAPYAEDARYKGLLMLWYALLVK